MDPRFFPCSERGKKKKKKEPRRREERRGEEASGKGSTSTWRPLLYYGQAWGTRSLGIKGLGRRAEREGRIG